MTSPQVWQWWRTVLWTAGVPNRPRSTAAPSRTTALPARSTIYVALSASWNWPLTAPARWHFVLTTPASWNYALAKPAIWINSTLFSLKNSLNSSLKKSSALQPHIEQFISHTFTLNNQTCYTCTLKQSNFLHLHVKTIELSTPAR
jgi:hypothetical protein